MKNNLFPIAKEGWNYLAYSLVLCCISIFLDFEILSFIFFVCFLSFAFIFRNPEREVISFEEKSVVSPVDGIITSIEEVINSEYFYKVTIESNYTDISILRIPLNGDVISHVKNHGTRLNIRHALAKKINENTILVFQDKDSNKIKIIHTTKESFCSIQTDTLTGRNLPQSLRYGIMTNGITEVYLPENFNLRISITDDVRSSQTLLGAFS